MELQLAIKDLNASQLRNTHEAGMFAANCDQSKQGMLSAALQVHGNRSRKVVIVGSFAYVLGRAQNNELRKSQDEARKPNRVLEDSHPLTHGCFVPNESQLFLPGGETKSKERSGRANVKSFDFNNYKRGGGVIQLQLVVVVTSQNSKKHPPLLLSGWVLTVNQITTHHANCCGKRHKQCVEEPV